MPAEDWTGVAATEAARMAAARMQEAMATEATTRRCEAKELSAPRRPLRGLAQSEAADGRGERGREEMGERE